MDFLEIIKSRLAYNQDTGEFFWTNATNYYTNGKKAGSLCRDGYRMISIDHKLYKAHRLAWVYVYGEMPSSEIDHINGVRDDNRISNLRLATREINTQNASLRKDSTSGFTGVSYYKPTGKWKAQIKASGKTKHLGFFDTPEEASSAYLGAKKVMHPGFVPERHGIKE